MTRGKTHRRGLERGARRFGLSLNLVVASGQRRSLRCQQRLVLVDHREQGEVGRERCGCGVQLTERMAGTGNCAEILEQFGVHRRRAVDEARDHQPIAGIEEDDIRVDTCRAADRAATSSSARLMYSPVPSPGRRKT